MMPSPTFDLGTSNFWNGLLVNAITFLLPLFLTLATFGINKWREKREKRKRQIVLIDLIERELRNNQRWVKHVYGCLNAYQQWVDSALQDRDRLPQTSLLGLVSSEPHSGVWESVHIEFVSLDRSHLAITADIVRSHSSYAEAGEQVDFMNQLIISAVQARASRGQAPRGPSAPLVYKMIGGLIPLLCEKLDEAKKQGKEALGSLKEYRDRLQSRAVLKNDPVREQDAKIEA